MYKKLLRNKAVIFLIVIMFFISITILGFLYNGIIWFNNPSERDYPVKGIDVSAYQGNIEWNILASQEIKFAFIKATEGSNFQDEKFAYNWEKANNTSLKVGAYHFFSYDSSGMTQAENFINTVPISENALPPVIDIEFYGNKEKNLPDASATAVILEELIGQLEKHYGKKPIIYATQKSYDLYIKDKYDEYPIWIRSVLKKPILSDKREWTFWQYSHREKLKGYVGEEKYIDMNVFNGTLNEFSNLAK